MSVDATAAKKPESQFLLLLNLKYRLTWGALKNDQPALLMTFLTGVVLFPFSIYAACTLYELMVGNRALAPIILRDVLALAYLIWFVGPLVGYSMNQSYDPTRLFIYPVRCHTIFAANVIGSLLEFSTLAALPILAALILAMATNFGTFVAVTLLLLFFMLQTIAMGQAVTFLLLGLLSSRRFRDIMIVLFPMLALLRYFYFSNPGQQFDYVAMLKTPVWKIADYLPPGWVATAIYSAQNGDWLRSFEFSVALIAATGLTVFIASTILQQLFSGERGSSPTAVSKPEKMVKRTTGTIDSRYDFHGAWIPVLALAQKEGRYLVRDPQYKAMGANALYMLFVLGFSFFRIDALRSESSTGNSLFGGWIFTWIGISAPILISGFTLFGIEPLLFNIFGGDGPAITMLLSFPTPRRYLVLGKNMVHGVLLLTVGLAGSVAFDIFSHNFTYLPLAVVWLTISTLIALAGGNLVSVRFPSKLMVRGSRFARGGQVNMGSSTTPGAGCVYGLLSLFWTFAVFGAELPAAAAIIIPGIGWLSPEWFFATIPFGLAYALGLYLLSLALIDVWMTDREFNILSKVAALE